VSKIRVDYVFPDGGFSTNWVEKVPEVGESVGLYANLYKVAAVRFYVGRNLVTIYLEFPSVALGQEAA
jgi:hypothetical protein